MKSSAWAAIFMMASLAVMAGGCVDQTGADTQFQVVNSDAWTANTPAEFTLDSLTTLRFHRVPTEIDILVRYSARNAPSTLPLVVLQESYLQPSSSDTLLIPLLNSKGEPEGEGSYGVYTATYTLRSDSLPEGWRLTLSPPDPLSLQGIQAVGYRLRK